MWSKRDVQHSWYADVVGQIEFEWAGQNQASRSFDVTEGRQAFLEKRAAQFEGGSGGVQPGPRQEIAGALPRG